MYIVKWPNVNNNAAVYKIYQSTNGTSWTSPQTVTFPEKRDAIIKVGSVWRMGYHRLASQGYPNYRFWTAISTNGRDFVQDQASLFNCGEDISLFYNTDSSKYYSYLRPIADTVHRKIGWTRSNDFVNWTSVDTILKVDLIDYAEPLSPDFRDQFYNMQVFRNGNDWWGCLNVLHNNDSGSIIYDTGQPGSTLKNNDQTIDLQLVYSHDGANWQRTNYRKPFIARQSNVKQLLGMGTIVDNEL